MAWNQKNRFTSKQDAMSRAKRCHTCLDCRHTQTEIYKECPKCGSKKRQYFMSETEWKRGMILLTMQEAGEITDIKFQPRIQLTVEGEDICIYTADAAYTKDGIRILEDSKPPNSEFVDEVSKIKMKLYEALFKTKIRIPQRE